MYLSKMLHPDAAENSAGNTSSNNKKTAKAYTPQSAIDIVAVSAKVNEKWAATPGITLLWVSQTEFDKLVINLSAAVSKQNSAAGSKPAETQLLNQLDNQLNKTVRDVKRGIEYKFGDNAVAQYARYGIEKEGGTYQLPRDRDVRLKSFDLMIAAIATDGFEGEDWNSTFWLHMKDNYAAAVKAAGDSRGNVSVGSATITTLMKEINKVSTALRYVLRANYPDTYQQVYRSWGWQIENY